ncbi:ABC-type putative transport system, permease component, partial [Dysosmobacter welbionis]
HRPVDGDGLGVAHIPVIVALSGVRNRLDRGPAVGVQRSVDRCHRDGLGGGLGHAALRIEDRDGGIPGGQGAGGGVGVPAHRPAAAVCVVGRHHHARGAELLTRKIVGPVRRVCHRDMVQRSGHRDGLGVRLGHIPLRIGNGDRGVLHAQGAVGGVGVPRHGPALAVRIVGCHHHALRVECLPVFVVHGIGRCGDLDTGQHPHRHRHGGGLFDPGPLVVDGDGRGVLGNAGGGECTVARHIFGGVILKSCGHHHALRVKCFPDVIGLFVGLGSDCDPPGDHQVHLIQQGAAHLHHLAGALPGQLRGHGPVSHIGQLKFRGPCALQSGHTVRTGHGGALAGGHLDGGALHTDGLF